MSAIFSIVFYQRWCDPIHPRRRYFGINAIIGMSIIIICQVPLRSIWQRLEWMQRRCCNWVGSVSARIRGRRVEMSEQSYTWHRWWWYKDGIRTYRGSCWRWGWALWLQELPNVNATNAMSVSSAYNQWQVLTGVLVQRDEIEGCQVGGGEEGTEEVVWWDWWGWPYEGSAFGQVVQYWEEEEWDALSTLGRRGGNCWSMGFGVWVAYHKICFDQMSLPISNHLDV